MNDRIVSVIPHVVGAEWSNWVIVQITTAEGLTGVGEATLEGRHRSVIAALAELERYLIGADPERIQHLWQQMYRQSYYRGGPAYLSAISGVDQALWDIKGKRAALPVYSLLGGACRDRLRIYGNGTRSDDAEGAGCEAANLAAAGYRAIKVGVIRPTSPVDSNRVVQSAFEMVAAVREAVGPSIDVAVDLHACYSPAMAIQIARALEPLGLWFLEEPVAPEDPADMALVARATSIPIATGERLFTKWDFRQLFAVSGAALIQPDLAHCGGISEARQIAATAESHRVGFAPHNPLGPVNTAAAAHLAMAAPNFVALEILTDDPSWSWDLVGGAWPVDAGFLEVPDRPGLGIELDLDVVQAHPVTEEKPIPATFQDDGAVADW